MWRLAKPVLYLVPSSPMDASRQQSSDSKGRQGIVHINTTILLCQSYKHFVIFQSTRVLIDEIGYAGVYSATVDQAPITNMNNLTASDNAFWDSQGAVCYTRFFVAKVRLSPERAF